MLKWYRQILGVSNTPVIKLKMDPDLVMTTNNKTSVLTHAIDLAGLSIFHQIDFLKQKHHIQHLAACLVLCPWHYYFYYGTFLEIN